MLLIMAGNCRDILEGNQLRPVLLVDLNLDSRRLLAVLSLLFLLGVGQGVGLRF